jgi:hypothetical protein
VGGCSHTDDAAGADDGGGSDGGSSCSTHAAGPTAATARAGAGGRFSQQGKAPTVGKPAWEAKVAGKVRKTGVRSVDAMLSAATAAARALDVDPSDAFRVPAGWGTRRADSQSHAAAAAAIAGDDDHDDDDKPAGRPCTLALCHWCPEVHCGAVVGVCGMAIVAVDTSGGCGVQLCPQRRRCWRGHLRSSTRHQLLRLARRASLAARIAAAAAAAAVSRSCACIGSPCLRHCVHGASIGGVPELRPVQELHWDPAADGLAFAERAVAGGVPLLLRGTAVHRWVHPATAASAVDHAGPEGGSPSGAGDSQSWRAERGAAEPQAGDVAAAAEPRRVPIDERWSPQHLARVLANQDMLDVKQAKTGPGIAFFDGARSDWSGALAAVWFVLTAMTWTA